MQSACTKWCIQHPRMSREPGKPALWWNEWVSLRSRARRPIRSYWELSSVIGTAEATVTVMECMVDEAQCMVQMSSMSKWDCQLDTKIGMDSTQNEMMDIPDSSTPPTKPPRWPIESVNSLHWHGKLKLTLHVALSCVLCLYHSHWLVASFFVPIHSDS